MSLVVTGILQNADVRALETALREAGLPLESIEVVTADDAGDGVEQRGSGSGLLMGDHAAAVPGISGGRQRRSYFRNESLADRLSSFEIPDAQLGTYVAALEAGRSVVAYFAKPQTLERVEAIFRSSGLANVTTF